MTFDIGQVIVWVIIGSIAGAFAAFIFGYRRRKIWSLRNLIIGLFGGIIGGFLFDLLNIKFSEAITLQFTATDLIGAFVGALILLFILRLISNRW